MLALHKNATTAPATRLALQQASGTDRERAQQYGIGGVDTVRKWRRRSTVQDASHTAHRLQTTLNAAQEELVIYLRTRRKAAPFKIRIILTDNGKEFTDWLFGSRSASR